MRCRLLILFAVAVALMLGGCRNAPEEERGDLHRDVQRVDDDNEAERTAMRAKLRANEDVSTLFAILTEVAKYRAA